MKNDLLVYSIEKEYQSAKHWVNFWVGSPVVGETLGEPEIMEWEVVGVERPTNLSYLIDKYREGFMEEYYLKEALKLRDELLHHVDSLATNPLRWSSLSDGKKEELSEYRQALLDVPQQEGFPYNIEWPVSPL